VLYIRGEREGDLQPYLDGLANRDCEIFEDNKRKTQKGAISNLVRKGPFLFWFDNRTANTLTRLDPVLKMNAPGDKRLP
jgi:hypothetical protein